MVGKVNSPFNQSRYDALLKGLEITVLQFSEVLKENDKFRFDSEYFKKEFTDKFHFIKKKGYKLIGEFAFVTDGIHTSIDYSTDSQINLLSATSPKQNVFDLSRNVFISKKAHLANQKTALKNGDIIISTVGTIGNCSVVTEQILPANCDRHVGVIRITQDFSPYFVSTFLLSKYGYFQTIRESTGNVQLNLFIYRIKTLIIPLLSTSFQSQVEQAVKTAHQLLEQSKVLYTNAETTLLQALDMEGWQPENAAVNIKTFANSFGASGRLDAEYYQSKYEQLEEKIKSVTARPLHKICSITNDNFFPKADIKYNYIELSDIGSTGNITGSSFEYGKDLPTRARRLVQTGDVIVSSIEGSLQKCAVITSEYNLALCSTGFYVIKSDVINSETLLVLLKSNFMQLLLKKACSGTILTAMNNEAFENILIPILPQAIQQQISDCVQASFNLRSESGRLLEVAKRGVEIAIEESEEAGAAYLQREGQVSQAMLLNQPFVYGAWAGQIKMSADFDEPLADFNEYM